MTIHRDHPFADPPSARDDVRRFRGRLAAGVTLWTSGSAEDRRAGLTVSSLLVAPGTPPRILALLDPLSDLADLLGQTGRAAVSILERRHRPLADAFAGLVPAPGGPFRQAGFDDGPWGPVPGVVDSWAGVRLEGTQEVGWSSLVSCVIEELRIGQDAEPLVHYRGDYPRLG